MLSLPARTQAVLEFFFSSTGRSSFIPVDEMQAEAAIFDLDTLESRQRWFEFRARTGHPGIALSVQEQPVEGAVWVQKPVTPAALLAAAAQVHAVRQQATASPGLATPSAAHPDTLPDPVQASHDPAGAVQAELAQAMAALPVADPVAAPAPAAPAQVVEPPALMRAEALRTPAPPTHPSVGAHSVGPEAGPTPASMPVAPPQARAGSQATSKPPRPEREPPRGGLGGLLRRFFGGGRSAAPAHREASPSSAPPAELVSASTGAPVAVAMPAGLPQIPSVPVVGGADQPAPADPAAQADRVSPPAGRATDPSDVEPASPPARGAAPESMAQTAEPAATPQPHEDAVEARPDVPPSDATPEHTRLGSAMAAQAAVNEARYCGLAADRSAQELAEDPELRYDPEVHLVSALREACLVGAKWQVPTQLDCSAGRIVVDTTRNLLLCDFDAERLESLFATPLGKRPKTRTLNRQEQAAIQSHTPHPQGLRRLDDLLWRAGLLTAVGRLPIDADPQRPVYLRHWPNLTRLTAIPHAVRIAAMWSARGASLVETAATLGIAQRHVIAFYNACSALDLLTDDGSHIHRAQRRVARNRGLLTRLLGWLHR